MSSQSHSLFKASLVILSFMVLGMVVIGGLTRLTGSGLSIVEWKPLTGIFPPLTRAEWLLEFSKYRQSPEFQKINFGMSLADFQSIFYLEYIHRLWGRLIGIVLLIPTYLMIIKRHHRELRYLLALLWGLGLGQGIMGWMMVKSGLTLEPHVSPYRLSAHLFLGFMIFATLAWMILTLYKNHLHVVWKKGSSQRTVYILARCAFLALFLVLLTALLGSLVAGLKAGFIYNTFPLMGGHLIPHEFLSQTPWWRDIFENPVSVQWLHRLFAITTTLFCGGLWVYQRNLDLPPVLTVAFSGMAIAVLTQFSLGVLTLLWVVPPSLALLHQCCAFFLFGSLIYILFLLYHFQLPHLFGFIKNSVIVEGNIIESMKDDWDRKAN